MKKSFCFERRRQHDLTNERKTKSLLTTLAERRLREKDAALRILLSATQMHLHDDEAKPISFTENSTGIVRP